MTTAPPAPSLAEATRAFGRIALLSFGGPAGQIAVMHRILVEEKRWIDEQRFLHALNFCMLLPGPEAQQLATYSGWLLHRTRGALIAGTLFVLPGAAAMLALSIVYALHGDQPVIGALFFGLKAAVLAIVAQALVRIAGRALKGPGHRAIAAAAFVGIFAFAVPFPLIVAGAALIGWATARPGPATPPPPPPASSRGAMASGAAALALWLIPVAALAALAGTSVFADIAVFFSQLAVVTFGGAYAVLAYMAQEAVGTHGWLAPGEMLDGLGLAETTPGPLIMVTQFVGFLAAFRDPGGLSPILAGTLGALLTTWVTFAPCFAWILLGAPFMERLRANAGLSAALAAVTAAVVGVIANLAIWFAQHVLFTRQIAAAFDPWAAALTVAALAGVFVLRLGMVAVLAGAAAGGLALHLAGLA
jgi:chromate transporter